MMSAADAWVCFDVDGTLVDHERAADIAVDHLAVAYPDVLGQLSPQDLRQRWRSLREHWFGEHLRVARDRCTLRPVLKLAVCSDPG